ncbi:MAG: hypothetical protein FJ354_00240 [Thaumarchaeota archaeon]|nr:hypothetical protein [Nitrososphaerota archaeon]
MRKITIMLNDQDYFDFLAECVEHGKGSVDELIYEIINYYLIVHRRRFRPNFRKSQIKRLSE